MRFLDLEHELDHLNQIWERFYYLGFLLYTTLIKDGRVITTASLEAPNLLTSWQNAIIEYHVRLKEFIRLHQRPVDELTLVEHAVELKKWSHTFWGKGMSLGQSDQKKRWQQRHFPDIFDLRGEVQSLIRNNIELKAHHETL